MFAVYSLPFLGDRELMLKQARCLFHKQAQARCLFHKQAQARCLFHKQAQARCLFHKFNRQDACSTNSTGKMPV
ncbi:hypothetical protein, partial [Microcoleus sp. B4-C1]|uniref:hypothetical protein n=1 Tax=Microcoleus sp. B4-C1 TaxID=2818660 RepID=UPI002FD62120